MNKKQLLTIISWATIILGAWVVFGAFDSYMNYYGEFYMYFTIIAGVIGILGAFTTLGILPLLGGLAISGAMIYLGFLNGFNPPILFTFLRGILLSLGGCGIILTFEAPADPYSIELIRLNIGKEEYHNLKNLGVNNLKDLVEEKGHEEEICAIASIPVPKLKEWICRSEEIFKEIETLEKAKLEKDYKKRLKK
ncbi:MAG: hypothetical protein LUQ65_00990 [Candidatus Helarchaeota archaeon]|nr:hypothetical protein [Candidatus Helarchaeota archaeon]